MSQYSWKHQYFENNFKELPTNIFRSLEVEQYLTKILKDNGFDLQNYKINFSHSKINILLSICKLKQTNLKVNGQEMGPLKKLQKLLERQSNDVSISKKVQALSIAKAYRHKIKYDKLQVASIHSLSNKILKSLKLFTNNKKTIHITIEEINFVNSNEKTKQILNTLFKFQRTPYYKEGKVLLTPVVIFSNSASLLSNFIAIQLKNAKKQQIFFFNFLQESLKILISQKFSKIQGIKIIIKGRINNAARSQNRIVKIGKISLISQNSKINYSESTAFTSNGTLGVKVWISLKK